MEDCLNAVLKKCFNQVSNQCFKAFFSKLFYSKLEYSFLIIYCQNRRMNVEVFIYCLCCVYVVIASEQ